jgi:hypothetical protein|tara:strand:+ start:549 stop:932 length:384 start_codon:yes stop_codon:yes gene_type:complete
MNQIFIGIILVLALGGYYLYSENVTLKDNNAKLVSAVEEQKETMAIMKLDAERQIQTSNNLQASLNAAELEKSRYLGILSRHNFERLAIARPGLMENRFNDGTKELFLGIEYETNKSGTSEPADSSN